MLRSLRLSILVVALSVLTALSNLHADTESDSLVGKPAPEINGDFALNGTLASMRDLKGKVVVLDFWAVWCGYCYDTFPHLREWHRDLNGKGLEVIGLTSYYQQVTFNKETGRGMRIPETMNKDQEQFMLKRLASHHKLDYRIQAAGSHDWENITQNYKIGGYPTVIVIDRKGVVQMVKTGSGQENARAVELKIKELLEQQ